MIKTAAPISFEMSLSGRDDGTLEAMYIQLIDEPVATTKEIQEDVLLADYSADGQLVGIEILSPVALADLVQLADRDVRPALRKFVRQCAPPLVTA